MSGESVIPQNLFIFGDDPLLEPEDMYFSSHQQGAHVDKFGKASGNIEVFILLNAVNE